MEISFDVLSQVPRLLKELLEIVQAPIEKRRERRIAFFDTEIAPIHESMKAIHQDYMAAFSDLSGLLDAGSTVPQTIELLKKRRLAHVTTRKDLDAYAAATRDLEKRGYLQKRELAALHAYAEAIKTYFKSASPVDMRVSWYTDFIVEFESLVANDVSPFTVQRFKSIEWDEPPVSTVRRAYADAVHHDLPEAWKQYSEAFVRLRLELRR